MVQRFALDDLEMARAYWAHLNNPHKYEEPLNGSIRQNNVL